MIWRFEPKVWTIKDIWEYQRDHNEELLSDYTPSLIPNEDFWKTYRDNYARFDRRFTKFYASWYPMMQEGLTLAEAAAAFQTDCYDHLLSNKKRYTELFRIENIPDDEMYSLTDNVNYYKEIERDVEFNKGQQINEVDGETGYGAQTVDDDKEFTYGAQGSTTEQTTSAYNESTYTPRDKSETDVDQHIDSQDNQMVYGSHTDTRDDTYTEGARKDTTDDDSTEHIYGNYGVMHGNDIVMKHLSVWENRFKFYDLIMADIARDLLRGVR